MPARHPVDISGPPSPSEALPSASPCEICADRGGRAFRVDFEIAFQPIVDLASRRIFAQECLVRGPNGEGADRVFAAVNAANRYSFDQKCRIKAIRTAAELGVADAISINIMPNAVYKPEHCIQATLRTAERHGWPVDKIIFEITEGERLRDPAHLRGIIEAYRRIGFRTAIDDFGAGYAGLTLLAEIRPDLIKLDMELVRGIDADPVRQSIIAGVQEICRRLGITIIAEGVETEAERDWLLDHGLALHQGRLYSDALFRATVTQQDLGCLRTLPGG